MSPWYFEPSSLGVLSLDVLIILQHFLGACQANSSAHLVEQDASRKETHEVLQLVKFPRELIFALLCYRRVA